MPMIDAVICQDDEGHRVLAKYYSKRAFRTSEEQVRCHTLALQALGPG